jgi:hypothetical protein
LYCTSDAVTSTHLGVDIAFFEPALEMSQIKTAPDAAKSRFQTDEFLDKTDLVLQSPEIRVGDRLKSAIAL